jgi:hypothetical protein
MFCIIEPFKEVLFRMKRAGDSSSEQGISLPFSSFKGKVTSLDQIDYPTSFDIK